MPATLLDGLRNSVGDVKPTEPRLQVMAIILVISLFAVSFPGASKAIPLLRIPHILFFIGKHFGTGVILATAFIHLLQDSFEALQKRQVKEYFDHVGEYTGLIILASLLSIFLIEYLSTSYVDYLHAEPSLPPTPVSSEPPSPQRSRCSTLKYETTPLLHPPRTQSTPHLHPPHSHPNHYAHHTHLPAIITQDAAGVVPIDVLTNSPRIIKMRGCTCVVGHACACPASALATHTHTPLSKDPCSREPSKTRPSGGVEINIVEPLSTLACEDQKRPAIGRKRQVIGLLVLQLGIMIHSIVIGLTLAITTGADFTSLTTAVIFHQLFEGLSLGIRIAALPPPSSRDTKDEIEGFEPEPRGDRGFLRKILLTLGGEHGEGWLKCLLAILFAITTPAGMGLGMVAFEVGQKKEGIELARMYLIQGLMSAISAGMLIYVSTVEMIAGDFVFGDVEGHSHHGHGHTHELPSMHDEENAQAKRSPRSPAVNSEVARLSMEEEVEETPQLHEDHYEHHHHHHGKIGKKILAVLSLLAGVGGMVLVGLGE
ncbi:Zinc-regulated transporter 2 [Leucoagaricus sp. SymC.cos]|nr:Zinc-regulated transporter 2 [Leucoagaricus sp. SymC.cos]